MTTAHDRPTTPRLARLAARVRHGLSCGALAVASLSLVALPVCAVTLMKTTGSTDVLDVPPVLLGLALVISTLAGATSLAIRIDRELSAAPNMPLVRPWVMSIAHMLAAWLTGIASFIVSRQADLDIWATLGSVLGASFLGAKALEMIIERWLPIRTRSPGSTEPQP